MGIATVSEAEFMRVWDNCEGNARRVSEIIGVDPRNILQRRRRIEKRLGVQLLSSHATKVEFGSAVVEHRIENGTCIVFSDAHIWPGPLTTMQRALHRFIERDRPHTVIANGDVFDGARISRFTSIGWEKKPEVADEIEAAQDFMGEIERLCPQAKRFWPLGNHDMRFESTIAARAPEFARVRGVHLKDHFPNWIPCWRVDLNDDIVVRHRELGGEHADFRNVVTGGKTIITGHDHRTGVVFYRNYRGLLYGVRSGYLGDNPRDPQFVNYLEAKEPNWHPAFVRLTFSNGKLLMPELVTKLDEDKVQFRGEIIAV